MGYRPWGLKEAGTTKGLSTHAHMYMHNHLELCLAQTKCFLRRAVVAVVMTEAAMASSQNFLEKGLRNLHHELR